MTKKGRQKFMPGKSNFLKFPWKKSIFYPDPRPPRFQTRLTPLIRGAPSEGDPQGSAPKYNTLMRTPFLLLFSSNRHDLFLSHIRTSITQTRSFASIDPSFCNRLLSPLCSPILFLLPSMSLSCLKSYLFPGASVGLMH